MAEDAHYWMRIHRRAQIVRLPGRHYYHRLHERSLTGRDYGAYAALRVAAQARREVLGLCPRDFRRQVAAAYVEEAFAAYLKGEFVHVRRCLRQAALREPRRLAKPAVVLLWARSLGQAARARVAEKSWS